MGEARLLASIVWQSGRFGGHKQGREGIGKEMRLTS